VHTEREVDASGVRLQAARISTVALVALLLLLPSIAASEPDILDLPLDELMERSVRVDVASYFNESELVVGSTVERISREDWRICSTVASTCSTAGATTTTTTTLPWPPEPRRTSRRASA
jgi:hypothetical protein